VPKAAVLDANVLFPIALADLLLNLAQNELLRPVWTDTILAETAASVDRSGRGDVRPRIAQMVRAFPDAMVHDWPKFAEGLDLPDPDDVHVAAAAIAGRAETIVTFNLRDFPPDRLPVGIRAEHPDAFLCRLMRSDPEIVRSTLAEMAALKKFPPQTVDELLEKLEAQGLSGFVAAMRAVA
jgi:predicted nucleic acid-binding protein